MQFHSCFNYFDNFVGQLAGNQIGNFLLAFDCTLTLMMITAMRNAAGLERDRKINKMTCNECLDGERLKIPHFFAYSRLIFAVVIADAVV